MALQAPQLPAAEPAAMPITNGVSLDVEKVKALRMKCGLSLDAAARAAGFTNRQRWFEIESGAKTNITLETLDKLARALGVKAKDLLK
jgi:transcriptional regulator with XRE-family HTH domain